MRGETRYTGRLLAALVYPLTTGPRTLAAIVGAVVAYVVLVASAFPTYTLQMVRVDAGYLDDAVLALTGNLYATAGWLGVSLVVVYAVLTGIAVVVAGRQIRTRGLGRASGLSTVLPGLVAAGCASCGAGLVGLVGAAGAVALLPYDGNLLRALGVLLLLGYLTDAGDPTVCRVEGYCSSH